MLEREPGECILELTQKVTITLINKIKVENVINCTLKLDIYDIKIVMEKVSQIDLKSKKKQAQVKTPKASTATLIHANPF